jgi:hypothetical protein
MRSSRLQIIVLAAALVLVLLSEVSAQQYDISSGGQPTINGAVSGSVIGDSSVLNDLAVTINFGEVSPSNFNGIVTVVVPIAIRSTQPYQVSVSITSSTDANAQAIQKTDIGFGVGDIRAMGANSRVCPNSSHIFYSPFNNNPANNVTLSANGRATYPSTLNSIGASTVILSGPRLSQTAQARRRADNGYIFDAVFAITPQFYAPGSASATLVFTISAGPNVPC